MANEPSDASGPILTSVVVAVLAGLVAGVGVALWSNDSPGGPASAEVAVGLAVGAVVFLLSMALTGRLARKGLLGEPERMAGGVGEESATANPEA